MNYQTNVFTILKIEEPHRNAKQPWVITVDFGCPQTMPWTNAGITELFWSSRSRVCSTSYLPLRFKTLSEGMRAVAVVSVFNMVGPSISEIMLLEKMTSVMAVDYTLQPQFNIDKMGSGVQIELIRIFRVQRLKELCLAKVKPEQITQFCI